MEGEIYMDQENKFAMPSVSRRGFVGGAAAVVAGLGLAACSGNNNSGNAGSSSSSDSNVEEIKADKDGFVVKAEKTDGKADKNECVVSLEGDMQEMHPMNWSDGNSGNVVYYMYDSLYKLDEDYNLVPAAADSYEVTDDGLTYTFHIHDGITFEDGTPLDADAVVTNYQEVIKKENGWRRRRTFIRTIDENTEETRVDNCYKVDDLTVAFHLPQPYSPFMNSITQFYIVNPKVIVDPNYDYGKKSAGSGPYILEDYKKGDHCSMTLRKDYWGGPKGSAKPSIKRVNFKVVPEAGSRIAALQTGEATVIYPMPTDQVATIRKAGDINMISLESTTMRYVTLNTNVDGLNDVRVRQAMNYAFNQDEYVKVMYAGSATPATSFLPEKVKGYKKQKPYDYNLKKAKKLMKEAGYEDGFKVTIIGDNSTQETKGMTFVMQQMKKIGIDVDVQPNEAATNADIAAQPEDETKIQMWYVNWSQNDADGFLRALLSKAMVPPTGYNTAFWKNDEFDAELEAGNKSVTVEEQNKHYGNAQTIAWKECPWLYLASDNTLMSYKSYLEGIKYVPAGIDVTTAKINH